MKIKTFYILTASFAVAGWLWLFTNFIFEKHQVEASVCLSKKMMGIPCPSCGTTRSVLSFFKGDFLTSFYWNPLGILSAMFLIISPLWILYDVFFQKKSFFEMFEKSEKILKNPFVFIPLIVLVLINWAWNIYKGV